ncbi:IS110 family transposase [Pseudonocardia sp. NPDC046786]|uniref:IS110 family transposase n=1 Tax=Pseudonocardia sp. NPDC046786 TaxID=3155471 RepID=UPI0033FB760E
MSNTSTQQQDRVVIAVDPHKASWTAAAVGAGLTPLATLRVPVSQQGYRQLRRFANRWPNAVWAIEGAIGLGAPLATRLSADGIDVVDVPAKLASRVRTLSTGHGRKSDSDDAVSVGIAALTAAGLRSVAVDETITALRALVEHRDDIVRTRTQTVNRLHALLTKLLPGGVSGSLDAETAARALRRVRPRTPGPRTLRRLAVDLVGEVRHLDRRIAAATTEISAAVAASGSSLTELRGIGDLTAGKILARVGNVHRFRSAAAFASYTGTAPIEVSSGDTVRHRLSRAGDRQLNCCLHIMAISQIRHEGPGRTYYRRKRTAGKSHKEAMRCLKRRLSDLVFRELCRDAARVDGADPGGHQGATRESSATGSTPTAGSSDKSLPGPAAATLPPPRPRST